MPNEALQKLCKWRAVLAGWHIGSRTLSAADGYASPGVPAMRDLMDKWLVMRAENSAIASLLIKKGVFTATEFTKELNVEAQLLDTEMERLFPGLRTTLDGVAIYDLEYGQGDDAGERLPAVTGHPPRPAPVLSFADHPPQMNDQHGPGQRAAEPRGRVGKERDERRPG